MRPKSRAPRNETPLKDDLVAEMLFHAGPSREVARQLGAALLNDAEERLRGAALLDALGQLPGQGAPEVISDLAVYAPVTEDPDLSLEEGDEDEDARFPLRPVSAFLIEAVDRPLPHRVLDPLLVEKGELQMGEPSE